MKGVRLRNWVESWWWGLKEEEKKGAQMKGERWEDKW